MVSDTTAHDGKHHRLERSLVVPVSFKGIASSPISLLDRMHRYNIPGVSVALIDGGEVSWAKTWGTKDANTGEAIDSDTLFQAASISKQVAAVAALKMVERGQLCLTPPINKYLSRWKVPNNAFTEISAVTLEHLLCHTSGTTVHGYRGFAQDEVSPSIVQILNGDPAAKSDAVVVSAVPGTSFGYSGGGYTVCQVAMEDVSKEPFAKLLNELVIAPAKMVRSTFEQPLPKRLRRNIAFGHGCDGSMIDGGFYNYPQQAAASLWTTPTDLAKFSLSISDAFHGKGDVLMGKSMCNDYLRARMNSWGLGPRIFERNGRTTGFGHVGANTGYRCESVFFLNGCGAVVMTNSDSGNALVAEIMTTLAEIYDWPERKASIVSWSPLDDSCRRQLIGQYQPVGISGIDSLSVESDGDGIRIELHSVPLPNTFFLIKHQDKQARFSDSSGIIIDFEMDDNAATTLKFLRFTFSK